MINYELPTEIEIDGEKYPIQLKGDYRMILDVLEAMSDPELTANEKPVFALNIFYNFNIPYDIEAAYNELNKFINLGEEEEDKPRYKKPLMNWKHDFKLIAPAINKVLGYDVRSVDYLHWWTFMGAYMEIDRKSTFAYVVSLRQKMQEGKLDKEDRKFIEQNRKLVYLPTELSEEDREFLMEDD